MPYSTILYEQQHTIVTITLNRPDKRNSFNKTLMSELHGAILRAGADESVKTLILRGAGKVFCAGMDLSYLQEIAKNSVMENKQDSMMFRSLLHSLYTCPKATIAQVHGAAIAGGCGLASVCDIVVAGREKALFGYSEVKIGFVPAIVSVYAMQKIGGTQARRLLLTAENINAEEAFRLGLVTMVVDDEELAAKTMEVAQIAAANSSSAIGITKELLANIPGMSTNAALDYACSLNAIARTTDDFRAGIARFLEKQ